MRWKWNLTCVLACARNACGNGLGGETSHPICLLVRYTRAWMPGSSQTSNEALSFHSLDSLFWKTNQQWSVQSALGWGAELLPLNLTPTNFRKKKKWIDIPRISGCRSPLRICWAPNCEWKRFQGEAYIYSRSLLITCWAHQADLSQARSYAPFKIDRPPEIIHGGLQSHWTRAIDVLRVVVGTSTFTPPFLAALSPRACGRAPQRGGEHFEERKKTDAPSMIMGGADVWEPCEVVICPFSLGLSPGDNSSCGPEQVIAGWRPDCSSSVSPHYSFLTHSKIHDILQAGRNWWSIP